MGSTQFGYTVRVRAGVIRVSGLGLGLGLGLTVVSSMVR